MGGVGGGFATTWEKRTPREDGGGLYVGVREGKDGFPPPSSRGQAIRGDTGGCTPLFPFPLQGEGKEGRRKGGSRTGSTVHRRVECEGERWVPAPVFTRAGYSRGHGRVHPHPNLPP